MSKLKDIDSILPQLGIYTFTLYSHYCNLAKEHQNYKYVNSPAFLKSKQWLSLRYLALADNDGCCEACGAKACKNVKLVVDHILPRRLFPELALSLDNLQVLCNDCNLGKMNGSAINFKE